MPNIRSRAAPGTCLRKCSSPDLWTVISADPKLSAYAAEPDFVEKVKQLQANPQLVDIHLQDKRIMALMGKLMGVDIRAADDHDRARANEPPPQKKPDPPKPAEPVKPDLTKLSDAEAEALEPKEQAQRYKELGNAAYKNKNFAEAIRLYDLASEKDDTDMSFLTNRAAVQFEQGFYDQCVGDCEKAIQVGRSNMADYKLVARAYERIGNAKAKVGDLAGAIEAYDRSLVESHNDKVYKTKQDLVKKKKLQDEQNYVDPAKAAEEKEKGNELFKAGDFPTALKHYSEAIKRNPKDHVLYSNRAACYTKLMDFASGMKDVEKCLELEPKFAKAYSRKGAIQVFLKEYHKAMETYKVGLALEPDNQELKDGLAGVIAKINDSNSDGKPDQQRLQRAMADPEIQAILHDPVMSQVLQEMQQNPQASQKHMRDPTIMAKIQKLIAAGVLQMK